MHRNLHVLTRFYRSELSPLSLFHYYDSSRAAEHSRYTRARLRKIITRGSSMLAIPFFLFLFLLFLLLLFLLPPFLFFLLLFSFLSCAFLLAQRLLFPSTILRSLRSRNNEVLHFLASPSLSFLYLSFSVSTFYLLDFFRAHPSLRLLSRNTLRRRLASPRNELRRRRGKNPSSP